jgi:hypothetical protein
MVRTKMNPKNAFSIVAVAGLWFNVAAGVTVVS